MSKRNTKFDRIPRGLYLTPEKALRPLYRHLRVTDRIWEPCAANGALARMLNEHAPVVAASDIHPLDDSVGALDALAITPAMAAACEATSFITNPPWPEPRRNGEPTMAILRHLNSLLPTWALLPADFMHTRYGATLMPRCAVVVSIGRVKWIEGSEHEGYDNACWYLFAQRPQRAVMFYSKYY